MKKIYTSLLMCAMSVTAFGAVPFQKADPQFRLKAMEKRQHAVSKARVPQTVLNEDFSLFSEGSETAPAAEIEYENGYYVPASLTARSGWTGNGIHPAGGAIALMERSTEGYSDWGFISTPPLDLGGTATLTLRARRLTPGDSEGSLWIALCDDYYGPGDDQETFYLTNEWKEYTVEATHASMDELSYFQIQAEDCAVLIDDVKIEFVRDRINPPSVNNAINVSPTEFIANWDDNGAPAYRLNVYRMEMPDVIVNDELTESFDGININPDGMTINTANPSYPEGWTISLSEDGTQDVANNAADMASAPVALKFDSTSDFIESPVTPEPIDEISFWVKPTSMNDNEMGMSLLRIEIYHSLTDRWDVIAQLACSYLNANGGIYTVPEASLGNDVTKVRLSLIQLGKVNFYVDDVKLHYSSRGTLKPVITDLDVTGTQHHVTDVNHHHEYYYYVQSVDDDLISEPSYHIWVDGITGLTPEVNEPTDVAKGSFTASWKQLGHATDYTVTGYRISSFDVDTDDVLVLEENFDAINEGTTDNPGYDWISPFDFSSKGWAATPWLATNCAWANGMAGSRGTTYWGTAGLVCSPNLNLSGNNGQGFDVEATVFTTVENFDYDGLGAIDESIFVMALNSVNDTESLAFAEIETPVKGSTHAKVTVPNPNGADLSNVIVAFMSKSGQLFFVDDVKITQSFKAGESLVIPFMNDKVQATTYNFTDLDPDYDHGFTVTASTNHAYEDFVSQTSEMKVVKTSQAGINGVEAAASTVSIATVNGAIIVEADDNTAVSVYSVSGAAVASAKGSCTIAVAPGIYVVKAANETVKVAVK